MFHIKLTLYVYVLCLLLSLVCSHECPVRRRRRRHNSHIECRFDDGSSGPTLGSTPESCSWGYWGSRCQHECHCTTRCNKSDGRCHGRCTGNYAGSSCTTCADYYKRSSSNTCVLCAAREWGTSCQHHCPNCRVRCFNSNGHCSDSLCRTGYTGIRCENCADGYTGQNCLSCETGYRRIESSCVACTDGRYGDNCALQCHCSTACNKVTGVCSGTCDPGYSGTVCSECPDDRWGAGCSNDCNCRSTCDNVNGRCSTGCITGYTGSTCQQCATGYSGRGCSTCTTGYVHRSDTCVACDNGMWGTNCADMCHCTQTCDRVSGVCGAACEDGYYGNQCQNTCTPNTWGAGRPGSNIRCPGSCNCADPDEVCRTTDGLCSSGCADWYTSTGCDYQMPCLGVGETSQILYVNGRNVTVQFTQWRREFGGTGTVSYYKVEYSSTEHDEYINLSSDIYLHIASQSTQTINITLPDVRSNCTIRIVPYESSDAYSGPGKPSTDVFVYTECADGWFGEDCDQQCNCADATDICDKTDGSCQGCYMGHLGSDCQIKMPTFEESTLNMTLNDNELILDFAEIPETDAYSISYQLEIRLQGTLDWNKIVLDNSGKASHVLSVHNLAANSIYEYRIIPQVSDIQRNIIVFGKITAIYTIETGCQTPSYMSDIDPTACQHWCDCGNDEYCVLTADYCNGLCEHCTRLPNANNTDVRLTPDSKSIDVRVTYTGENIDLYTVWYARNGQDEDLQHNISSSAGGRIAGLSSGETYHLMMIPFVIFHSSFIPAPAIFTETNTTQAADKTGVIIGVAVGVGVLAIASMAMAIVCIRYRRQRSHKSVEKSSEDGEYAEVDAIKANSQGEAGMFGYVDMKTTDGEKTSEAARTETAK